jgi:GNAT superfamily N-acetyltransferase
MDTLVFFERELANLPDATYSSEFTIRRAVRADASAVATVAKQAFRGYVGHYHADPRLEPKLADGVYVEWARRSCLGAGSDRSMVRGADAVFVAQRKGATIGFLTVLRGEADDVEIVLNAVSPDSQRQGLLTALTAQALRWAVAENKGRAITSTHLANISVQRVWTRIGFRPFRSLYTFHLWLDAV